MAGKNRYKILKQKEDCTLLLDTEMGYYAVRDCENYLITMTMSKTKAENSFEDYSIDAIRKARKQAYEEWLEENAFMD